MKNNTWLGFTFTICLFMPLVTQANPLQTRVERAVAQAVENSKVTYYVPLIQLKEQENVPGADGAEAGIFWVEIGGTNTADGYEPEFFYLISKKVDSADNDGPAGPCYEEIIPSVFNEAYKRFAADARSAKATISQTRKLLTLYYRQVQAGQEAKPAAH